MASLGGGAGRVARGGGREGGTGTGTVGDCRGDREGWDCQGDTVGAGTGVVESLALSAAGTGTVEPWSGAGLVEPGSLIARV